MYDRYYNYTPYAYVLNNPISKLDIYGLTDWDAVRQGLTAFAGGAFSTGLGIGAALTPTGVGQVTGAILVPTGIATMGAGAVKVIAGILDNGTADKTPGGMLELPGIAGDAFFGNENGELRKVGMVLDFSLNFVGGGPTNAVEALVIGAQAISLGEQVFDNKNTGQDTKSTGTTSNKATQGTTTTNTGNTTTQNDTDNKQVNYVEKLEDER